VFLDLDDFKAVDDSPRGTASSLGWRFPSRSAFVDPTACPPGWRLFALLLGGIEAELGAIGVAERVVEARTRHPR
jgi:hypothetical protein